MQNVSKTPLYVVWLLGALASSAFVPFLVLWAHRDAGLSGATAGLLFLVLAVGEVVGGIAGGTLADRYGLTRVLLLATVGMAVGYGLLAIARGPVSAVALILVAGLFESTFHPTIGALIAARSTDDELQPAYTRLRAYGSVGSVLGPLLGAAAVAVSLRAMFVLVGALLLVAAGIVLLRVAGPGAGPEAGDGEDEHDDFSLSSLGVIRRDGRLAMLIFGGGLLSVTYTWWDGDGLVLLRHQTALGTTAFGVLFAIAALATILLQRPTAWLARRYAVRTLLLAGGALQGVGLAVLATASAGYPVLVVSALVIELGQMTYGPSVSAFVARRAQAAGAGGATYQAALSTTQDIGGALGPTSGLAIGGVGAGRLVWLLALPVCLIAGFVSGRAAASVPDALQPPEDRAAGS